jgi:hypothetical protein
MKTFKFHSDAGHGWLAVKLTLLQELNIADKISKYSYLRGQSVYLEEDVDAKIFHDAYTSKYGQYDIETLYYNRRSPIRGYVSFTPDLVERIMRSKQRMPFQERE